MILSNDKKLVAYNEDFKPMLVYGNGLKLGGYKEETYNGKNILAVDTYNDVLTVTVNGHHEQDKKYLANFNQLINTPKGTSKVVNGVTITYNNDGSITTSGTATSGGGRLAWNLSVNIVSGHKYYLKSQREKTDYLYFTRKDDNTKYFQLHNKDSRYTIATAPSTVYGDCYVGFNVMSNNEYNETFNLNLIDLTQMFGEGKEPTLEQCQSLFTADYYPYNEGTWEEIDLPTVNPLPTPERPKEIRVLENPKIKIGSKEIVWNQLMMDNWRESMSTTTSAICNVSVNDDVVRVNFVTSGNPTVTSAKRDRDLVQGHKYFTSIRFKDYSSDVFRFRIYTYSGAGIPQTELIAPQPLNGSGVYCDICTMKFDTMYKNLYIFLQRNGAEPQGYAEFDQINIFDLTEMFGEGAEPKTVEEFRRLFPKDYYPYDSGTTKTLSTLYDTLNPVEPTETILPFKLYGNGTVNDTCEPCVKVNGEWKCRVTRRWGSADLGDYNYKIVALNGYNCFHCVLENKLNDSESLCSAYTLDNYVTENKTFASRRGVTGALYIRDDSYTDVETFKQSVQGVQFVYPLLEPTIELYDPIPIRTLPINTQIECDGEMEAVIKTVDLL